MGKLNERLTGVLGVPILRRLIVTETQMESHKDIDTIWYCCTHISHMGTIMNDQVDWTVIADCKKGRFSRVGYLGEVFVG